MILTSLILFMLAYTPRPAPNNEFYNKGGIILYKENMPTLVSTANPNPFFVETEFTLQCYISYDDANSWYLNDFTVFITAKSYYMYTSTTATLDDTLNFSKNYDWEFTPSSYNGELDNVSYKVKVEDDEVSIKSFNNGVVDSNIATSELDYYVAENLELTINLSGNAFFNSLNNLLDLTITDESYDQGYGDGYTQGYQSGYTEGYTLGATQDETAVAIFSGIINIALVPINFFLACLNFEVFGINIGAFVSALLTIAIIVIIMRIIFSGGNKGD